MVMEHIGKELSTGPVAETATVDTNIVTSHKNILFLDVDGVLNCQKTYYTKPRIRKYTGIDEDKVKLLKEIVDFLDADIVLSSSWKSEWYKEPKEKDFQDEFANALDKYLAAEGLKILDKTSDTGWNRGQGILKWLKDHAPESNFIILDDEWYDFDFVNVSGHWMKTEYIDDNGGLNREIVDSIKKHKDDLLIGNGPYRLLD